MLFYLWILVIPLIELFNRLFIKYSVRKFPKKYMSSYKINQTEFAKFWINCTLSDPNLLYNLNLAMVKGQLNQVKLRELIINDSGCSLDQANTMINQIQILTDTEIPVDDPQSEIILIGKNRIVENRFRFLQVLKNRLLYHGLQLFMFTCTHFRTIKRKHSIFYYKPGYGKKIVIFMPSNVPPNLLLPIFYDCARPIIIQSTARYFLYIST